MRYKRLSFWLSLLLMQHLGVAHAAPQETTIGEIKNSLVCLCDCNMTVEACEGSMACDSAKKLTAEAVGYIEQGMNKEAVLATFIGKYGEHVLAAPTKKGFNLIAWILPFAAIFFASFGIIAALKRWVKQQQGLNANFRRKNGDKGKEKSPYEDKLDEVLRYLD